MVVEQAASHPTQGFLHGRHLGQHIGAVALLFDHSLKAPHLSLDATQSRESRVLQIRIDVDRVGSVSGAGAAGTRGGRFRRHADLLQEWGRGVYPRSLRLFTTTLTELTAIAAAAIAGVSRRPNAGYSTPAATGMPITL